MKAAKPCDVILNDITFTSSPPFWVLPEYYKRQSY